VGAYATEAEKSSARAASRRLVENVDEDLEELQEGSEPKAFWRALGGQGEYWQLNVAEGRCRLEPDAAPRVFVCDHGGQGTFSLMELPQYNQVNYIALTTLHPITVSALIMIIIQPLNEFNNLTRRT
jgi:hypothetical protein